MKTYLEFLREELKRAGHDVEAGIDYLDVVQDEIENAAVLYSMQNRRKSLDQILEYIDKMEWTSNAFEIEQLVEKMIDDDKI